MKAKAAHASSATKGKTISFVPSPQLEKQIVTLKNTLRTSKAGLAEIALEFVIRKFNEGKAQVVNGAVEIIDSSAS